MVLENQELAPSSCLTKTIISVMSANTEVESAKRLGKLDLSIVTRTSEKVRSHAPGSLQIGEMVAQTVFLKRASLFINPILFLFLYFATVYFYFPFNPLYL